MRNAVHQVRKLFRLIRSFVAETRRRVGWPHYHDLKLPMRDAQRIIEEAGAEKWFVSVIRNRPSRREATGAMDWIVSHVPRHTAIFEPGCGCAANLIWLGQHGFIDLAGSDRSAEAISAAKKLADLAGVSVRSLDIDDGLRPSRPLRRIGLLLALNWLYLSVDFDLEAFLALYREALYPDGFVIFDMIDRAFDQMPDNQFMTDDWPLPEDQRRPTQYKVRMTHDQVTPKAAAAGFVVVTTLPVTGVPPRFVTVLQRR